MNKTQIEYLDWTSNPIKMRCTPISEGCANCWHISRAKRLAENPLISEDKRIAYRGGPPILDLQELKKPLRIKKPSRIGVQFMGDLFHKDIPSRFISEVMWTIQRCGWHNFLMVTKRPNRMREFLDGSPVLNNLWLGVSVEDQQTADERIPILRQIPAAKRFVSGEPMLGKIDLYEHFAANIYAMDEEQASHMIHWFICGGETGHRARPMNPDWVRFLRDQCQAAGVPFFFKHWGEWLPALKSDSGPATRWSASDNPQSKRFKMKGRLFDGEKELFGGKSFESKMLDGGQVMIRVGKKKAGRLLDGREWDEIPK